MYFTVCEPHVLRGWELLPYAVSNTEIKQVIFMRKGPFSMLLRCDGNTEIHMEDLNEEEKVTIRELKAAGVIRECAKGETLSKEQQYKKYPSRFIKTAQWSITGYCNYKCRHCFMSAPHGKLGQLSLKECRKIVDELASCGVNNVSLTGGEPLVRSDFWEIVDALVEKGIGISGLYSNGKLVDEELLNQFEKRGQRPVLHMSFDGVGWHDWLRGIPGAEKRVLDAYELCKKRGFSTTAEMCLHKNNKDTLRETVNLMAELGVSSMKVNPVMPMGAWVEEADQYTMTPDEIYQVYLEYIPHYYEDHMPISLALEGFFAADKGGRQYSIPNEKYQPGCDCSNKSICGHARNSMYISPQGIALPCMPLAGTKVESQFPNILDMGLSQILKDSFYMKMIDVRMKEYLDHNKKCAACVYKEACGGGCRGFAIGEDNTDYLTIDQKACDFFLGGYSEKIRKTVEEAQKKWLD